MNKYKKEYLSKNPNARKADEYRKWLYNALNGNDNIETKTLTGLNLKDMKKWMKFTKQFYLPDGYDGKIDIEHLYPLSQYNMNNIDDVKFCLNWKHLRYTTHEYNVKKGKKEPSEKEIENQKKIVKLFKNQN